jgi:hypothetical protein
MVKNIPKYTNIFHYKALQNLQKLGFFGLKNIPSGSPGQHRVTTVGNNNNNNNNNNKTELEKD